MKKTRPSLRRISLLLIVPIFLIFMYSCSIPALAEVLNVWDRRVNDDYGNFQVNETSNAVVNTNQIIRIDNCDGDEVKDNYTGVLPPGKVRYQVTAPFNNDLALARLVQRYGPKTRIIGFFKVSALPGTNMEFVLTQTDQQSIGVISSRSQQGQSQYLAEKSLNAAITASRNLGCLF